MNYEIRPVRYSDPLFAELISEAAGGDGTFMNRLRDHWHDGSERWERPGELLLAAFLGSELVGTAGVSHDPYEPQDGLARLRHVYVLSAHRQRGIARALVQRSIDHARNHFDVLRLRTSNPAAARLYESLGFRPSAEGRESHRLYFQRSSTSRP